MDYNLNKEREKRLEKTGKWFEAQSSGSNKDIYLAKMQGLGGGSFTKLETM